MNIEDIEARVVGRYTATERFGHVMPTRVIGVAVADGRLVGLFENDDGMLVLGSLSDTVLWPTRAACEAAIAELQRRRTKNTSALDELFDRVEKTLGKDSAARAAETVADANATAMADLALDQAAGDVGWAEPEESEPVAPAEGEDLAEITDVTAPVPVAAEA